MSAENSLASVRRTVAGIVKQIGEGRSETSTAIKGLTVHQVNNPTEPSSYLYEPCFAFIAQGAKRVVLGTETYVYDESQFLLTTVGLPTVVQVLGATPAHPYLSIKLDFDLDLANDLIAEVDETGTRPPVQTSGLAVSPVTPKLAEATLRLVELLMSPEEIPILARGIQKELLYRVLISPGGDRLRQAVLRGSQTNRVSTAIRYIRKNFAHPIRIETLAEKVGMGASTLHYHFRAVTTMSPIQYQKQLRLHEARRILLRDELTWPVLPTAWAMKARISSAESISASSGTPRKAMFAALRVCKHRVLEERVYPDGEFESPRSHRTSNFPKMRDSSKLSSDGLRRPLVQG